MVKYLVALLAACAAVVATAGLSAIIGYDLGTAGGWWACMAYFGTLRRFEGGVS